MGPSLRRTMPSIARLVVAAMLALAGSGCTDELADSTPSGALRLFLAAMERTEDDPDALREAYALLSASTRRALRERARLAESLGAAPIEPWEMLVRGRYSQTFVPARGSRGTREVIEGERATVILTSAQGDRRAEVPLVREQERWRVVLTIPPVRAAREE